LIRAIIAFSGATIVRHGYYRLPTRVFVVLPNSGHVTNEGALAEFVNVSKELFAHADANFSCR